jgi:hypothetical protein
MRIRASSHGAWNKRMNRNGSITSRKTTPEISTTMLNRRPMSPGEGDVTKPERYHHEGPVEAGHPRMGRLLGPLHDHVEQDRAETIVKRLLGRAPYTAFRVRNEIIVDLWR